MTDATVVDELLVVVAAPPLLAAALETTRLARMTAVTETVATGTTTATVTTTGNVVTLATVLAAQMLGRIPYILFIWTSKSLRCELLVTGTSRMNEKTVIVGTPALMAMIVRVKPQR